MSMVTLILAAVIAFALLVLAYALVSHRLGDTVVTGPMFFVAAGLILGPVGLGVINFSAGSTLILAIAAIALVFVLFTDAARINLRALTGDRNLPLRLLAIGLPLTILAGAAGAMLLFTTLTIAEAALLGSILAPTDASLGIAIVNSPLVPARIRQALNVESGLNDGGAIPFFALFLVLAEATTEGQPAGAWAVFALQQIGLGILAGAAIGIAGSLLIQRSRKEGWMRGEFTWIAFLALALLSFFIADALGGSGFIAAFVAGLLAAAIGGGVEESVIEFSSVTGEILSFGIFFIFGLVAAGMLTRITAPVLLYAVLSLTLVRMVPVALSLAGTHLKPSSVAFIGWFGPRGLASIVLLLIAMDEAPGIPGLSTIALVVATTILLSVFAHGITANPAIGRYAKLVARLPADAPERREVLHEVPTRAGGPGTGKI
jgi:NhaP-type Na+/H+ or K+/H+ antiporter